VELSRLAQIYAAWSAGVPFDNVRKMIALRTGAAELPGMHAEDFFTAWLAHGTGATCWPGSTALHALLVSEGFNAQRATGSMRDLGIENHGTLVVHLEGVDWLVDSSMSLHEPVALRDTTYQRNDRFDTEVEVVDGTHVIWYAVPPHNDGFPCRLLRRNVDEQVFVDRYNESRDRSPFNSHLYARRNTATGTVVIRGTTRFERTSSGAVNEVQLDRDGVLDALASDIGISATMIDAWVACGALDATMEPYTGPPPTPLLNVPPSRR
jgi:arylamine N-acetyltransferase